MGSENNFPTAYKKRDFPLDKIRRFLEPTPAVLVSSAWRGRNNIMTMGWYTVLEFMPALIGCYIWSGNHSFGMIRKSKECVLNIPTVDLAGKVIRIGNSRGDEVDKCEELKLTPLPAAKVKAPLIKECYANFERRVVDTRMVNKYSFFIFKVLKAHVA